MTKNHQTSSVSAGIRAETLTIGLDESFEVTFFVQNNTAEDVRLLIWNTPLEDWLSADVLTVMYDGNRLAYQGRKVKRGSPSDKDYVLVKAGDSVEKRVDLGNSYPLAPSGDYVVLFTPSVDTATGNYQIEDQVVEVAESVAIITRQ